MSTNDMTSSRWYVYILLRPDGRAIYVGKGTGSRVLAHEAEAARGCTCYKCRAIRKVWRDGGEIRRDIVFRTDDEDAAYDYERDLIAEIGLENLCNIAEGGRVPPQVEAAIEQRKHLAARSEGSIYCRKDGRWVGSLNMELTGLKPKRRSVYGATRTEVEEKLDRLREERAEAQIATKVAMYSMDGLRKQVERTGSLDRKTACDLIDIAEYCRKEYRVMKGTARRETVAHWSAERHVLARLDWCYSTAPLAQFEEDFDVRFI